MRLISLKFSPAAPAPFHLVPSGERHIRAIKLIHPFRTAFNLLTQGRGVKGMTDQLIFVAVLVVTVLSGTAAMVLALRAQQAASRIPAREDLVVVKVEGSAASREGDTVSFGFRASDAYLFGPDGRSMHRHKISFG